MKITITSKNLEDTFNLVQHMHDIGAVFQVQYNRELETEHKTKRDNQMLNYIYDIVRSHGTIATFDIFEIIDSNKFYCTTRRTVDRYCKLLVIMNKLKCEKVPKEKGGFENVYEVVV
jgi:hypothetical protein